MKNRILIVDDDLVLRSEFKECFGKYGVIEASSGEEAIEILKKANEIDLVILDVKMPGMNGIEVLNKIRKISPDIRIVILTGYGSKDVAVEALRGQADDYIEKSFDLDHMEEIVDKFLGTKRGQPDNNAIDIKEKIERVKSFLERNSLKQVTLKEASETICLSPKYLSRVFKEQAGEGFNEYKLKVKMEEAKNFLVKSGYNVSQISYKLGYENPESFIKQFKKFTGKTPTEYRNKIKKVKGKIRKRK